MKGFDARLAIHLHPPLALRRLLPTQIREIEGRVHVEIHCLINRRAKLLSFASQLSRWLHSSPANGNLFVVSPGIGGSIHGNTSNSLRFFFIDRFSLRGCWWARGEHSWPLEDLFYFFAARISRMTKKFRITFVIYTQGICRFSILERSVTRRRVTTWCNKKIERKRMT